MKKNSFLFVCGFICICFFGLVDGVAVSISEAGNITNTMNSSLFNVSGNTTNVLVNVSSNVSVNITNSSNISIVPLVRDPNKDYLFYDNLDCFLSPDNICCLTVEVARQQLRVNRPMCHNYTCIANPTSLHICGICPEIIVKSGLEIVNNNVTECDDMPFIETNPQEIKITYEGVEAINITTIESKSIRNDLNERSVKEVQQNQDAVVILVVAGIILLVLFNQFKPKQKGFGRGQH